MRWDPRALVCQHRLNVGFSPGKSYMLTSLNLATPNPLTVPSHPIPSSYSVYYPNRQFVNAIDPRRNVATTSAKLLTAKIDKNCHTKPKYHMESKISATRIPNSIMLTRIDSSLQAVGCPERRLSRHPRCSKVSGHTKSLPKCNSEQPITTFLRHKSQSLPRLSKSPL